MFFEVEKMIFDQLGQQSLHQGVVPLDLVHATVGVAVEREAVRLLTYSAGALSRPCAC